MIKYRISKFNPHFRDESGLFGLEDWTAISDIGKKHNGYKLASEIYAKTEKKYVETVKLIMDYANVPYLMVNDIIKSNDDSSFEKINSKYPSLYTEEVLNIYFNLLNKARFSSKDVSNVIKLLLREDIGADVYYKDNFKLFIGYDFLMGIHISKPIEPIIPVIEKLGLFVERFN